MRKTKIVATLGPSCNSEENIKKLMLAGVNIFRLNFSHGQHEIHAAAVENIHRLNEELDLNVGILADLSGPKIRTGEVKDGNMLLVAGEYLSITSENVVCSDGKISINYPHFAEDVNPGEYVLLDDGKLLLQIVNTNHVNSAKAKVIQGVY